MAEPADPRKQVHLALHSQFATTHPDRPGVYEFATHENLRILSLSLGTMELENTQYTIEEAWSRVRIDEGVALDDESRWLHATGAEGEAIAAPLPLYRNRIEQLAYEVDERSDTVEVRLRTEHPHGVPSLQLLRVWSSGLGALLVPSGVRLGPALRADIASDRELAVVLPLHASLPGALAAQQSLRAPRYLHFSPLCGPSRIAAVLGLAARGVGGDLEARAAAPGLGTVECTRGTVDGTRGAGRALGFGHARHSVRADAAASAFACRLTPGYYGPGALASAISVASRPLCPVQRGEEGQLGGILMLGDASGQFVPVRLASTSYTCATLSQYLSLCARGRLGFADVLVRPWGEGLEIATGDGSELRLSFAAAGAVLPSFLGLAGLSFEGACLYRSTVPLSYPRTRDGRVPRLNYSFELDAGTRRGTFAGRPQQVRLEDGALVGESLPRLAAGDLCHVTGRGLVYVAAGFPRVGVTVPADEEGDVTPRVAMAIGFEGAQPSGAAVVTVRPDAAFCLHMQGDADARSIKPEILGFEPRVYEPPAPAGLPPVATVSMPPAYRAPAVFCVDPPPYVLLRLGTAALDASQVHRAVVSHDHSIGVFAKLCFAPYRVERINPAETQVPEGDKLGPLALTLLNYDGTPYHTHGKPFSLSVVATAVNC